MPTAGEFCNRRVAIASAKESLTDAAARMRDERVGSLIVVDRNEEGFNVPIGVLTDRDVVVRILARTDRHLHSLLVEDAMTPQVIKAHTDDDLGDVVKRMRGYGIRRIPVVSRSGALEGIIVLDDIFEYLQEQLQELSDLLSREHRREMEGPIVSTEAEPRMSP